MLRITHVTSQLRHGPNHSYDGPHLEVLRRSNTYGSVCFAIDSSSVRCLAMGTTPSKSKKRKRNPVLKPIRREEPPQGIDSNILMFPFKEPEDLLRRVYRAHCVCSDEIEMMLDSLTKISNAFRDCKTEQLKKDLDSADLSLATVKRQFLDKQRFEIGNDAVVLRMIESARDQLSTWLTLIMRWAAVENLRVFTQLQVEPATFEEMMQIAYDALTEQPCRDREWKEVVKAMFVIVWRVIRLRVWFFKYYGYLIRHAMTTFGVESEYEYLCYSDIMDHHLPKILDTAHRLLGALGERAQAQSKKESARLQTRYEEWLAIPNLGDDTEGWIDDRNAMYQEAEAILFRELKVQFPLGIACTESGYCKGGDYKVYEFL